MLNPDTYNSEHEEHASYIQKVSSVITPLQRTATIFGKTWIALEVYSNQATSETRRAAGVLDLRAVQKFLYFSRYSY